MSATRPLDPASAIDGLLSGAVVAPPGEPGALRLSDDEARLLDRVAAWCAERAPGAAIEAADALPDGLLDELADLGALRIVVPREHGGLGHGDACLLAVLGVLAAEHATLCEVVAAHQVIGAVRPLLRFGTPEQRDRHLPACTRAPTAFALNEAELGAAVEPLGTIARRDVDRGEYVLDGEKCWITNATIAALVVVLAEAPGGVTAFLVAADDPGVEVVARSRFAGLRGLPNGTLRLSGVRLPAARRLGREGDGLDIALACLDECRPALPVACLTTIAGCLERARAWAGEERQRRRGLPERPEVERHLARLAVLAHLGRAVTGHALRDACAPIDREAAKVVLSEAACEATDVVLQLVGGRGYETAASAAARGAEPLPVERAWRDARVTRIFDGSSEQLKALMAVPLAGAPADGPPPPGGPAWRALAERAAELRRLLPPVEAAGPDADRARAEGVECALALFVAGAVLAEDGGDADAPVREQVVADATAAADRSLARLRSPAALRRTADLAALVAAGALGDRAAVPIATPGAAR